MRELLLRQLDIPWTLFSEYYLPAVTDDIAAWRPSANAVGLVIRDGTAYPEWPDETTEPIPDTTVGWLLWHIEWWWSNAIHGARGAGSTKPQAFGWSGSAEASRVRLIELHDQWVEILNTTDLDHQCDAPFPTPQPLSAIAGWVNVELMKNVAELGQLMRLRANRGQSRGGPCE